MKGSCAIVASVLAASTVALSSSSGDRGDAFNPFFNEGFPSSSLSSCSSENNGASGSLKSPEKEKFAPRFDGLRFIETLVTAHR
ncbi:uncharacterized protein LOC131158816 [Malania oleifera]|uniref:uncharacterized protein LOC131158816 n=1 Tax=Malania oleifera TaxID=397392 RepID=UPI0025ADD67A|nr:uncharacterized protein LOC131158816 [Malania oleifera]